MTLYLRVKPRVDLNAITIRLRRDRRDRQELRSRLWLLAFTAVAMVAYITFYATR